MRANARYGYLFLLWAHRILFVCDTDRSETLTENHFSRYRTNKNKNQKDRERKGNERRRATTMMTTTITKKHCCNITITNAIRLLANGKTMLYRLWMCFWCTSTVFSICAESFVCSFIFFFFFLSLLLRFLSWFVVVTIRTNICRKKIILIYLRNSKSNM